MAETIFENRAENRQEILSVRQWTRFVQLQLVVLSSDGAQGSGAIPFGDRRAMTLGAARPDMDASLLVENDSTWVDPAIVSVTYHLSEPRALP